MVEEQVVEIEEGRHPMIDLLLDGRQFVANDTKLFVSFEKLFSGICKVSDTSPPLPRRLSCSV